MTYLGLDYGTSHVGVALATGNLAEPLTTMSTRSALRLLPELIKKHHIDSIVIGEVEPKFLSALQSLGLPIHQIDETLTTKDAQTALLHTSPSRRHHLEHAVSATLILQSYLDSLPLA